MNNKWPILLTVLLLMVLLTGCAPAFNINANGLVVGESYRLRSGEVLNDDLTVIGGSAVLEKGSTVSGDVAVLGGSLSIDGTIGGSVNAMGGVVSIGDNAVIEGDVQSLGATISRSEKATINGNFGTGRPTINLPEPGRPNIRGGIDLLWKFVSPIFQSLALAAVAVLVSLFALRPMERIGDTVTTQPFLAGGLGLLTVLVLPFILVVISITIILLPVGLVGFLLLALAALFGWVAAGLVTGERLAHAFRQNWSGPVSAGVGTLVLSLLASLIGQIPCVGFLPVFLVSIASLGAVILTRFGMQVYPHQVPAMVAPVDVEQAPQE